MQDLLSGLQPPIVIGLIIAAIIALVAVVFLARRLRNRQTPSGEGLGPNLDAPVDYTSLPLDDEPRGWRERFARLSLAGKILAVLVPLLAILGLVALVLTLLPSGEQQPLPPTLVPITVRVEDATVIRADPLTIGLSVATTGLEDGAVVTAELLEDDQPFAWLNPEQARGTVRGNRAEFQAQRAEGSPQPSEGHSYTVIVRAPDGITSGTADLVIPEISGIADSFFGRAAAAVPPTRTSEPTATAAPTAGPEATPTPKPTATPDLPKGPPASVANGGNVRRMPIRSANNVIGGINAGEQVQLIERTPNGEWYRVRTVRDDLGWVSASLLSVPAGTQVPVANVVTVFVNGPVYEQANTTSTEVDRVNKDEVVQLLKRTAAGDWYQVTNMREITGWVPVGLLGIPENVAAAVPVAP
ncbi:MAG: SH3 domain-containing protein [Chloroflexales bacterium]|nr:SH3 domain-containing protein [Chloroflexales bacterium]